MRAIRISNLSISNLKLVLPGSTAHLRTACVQVQLWGVCRWRLAPAARMAARHPPSCRPACLQLATVNLPPRQLLPQPCLQLRPQRATIAHCPSPRVPAPGNLLAMHGHG